MAEDQLYGTFGSDGAHCRLGTRLLPQSGTRFVKDSYVSSWVGCHRTLIMTEIRFMYSETGLIYLGKKKFFAMLLKFISTMWEISMHVNKSWKGVLVWYDGR